MDRSRQLNNALVVEDEPGLRMNLARELGDDGWSVETCSSVGGVRTLLPEWLEPEDVWFPDIVVLDIMLDDGDALGVLEHFDRLIQFPYPWLVIISGEGTRAQAFELARAGALAFLEKPFEMRALHETLALAVSAPPSIDSIIRAGVGHAPLLDTKERIQDLMVAEGLRLTGGNVTHTAEMLGIKRQHVQTIRRRLREKMMEYLN